MPVAESPALCHLAGEMLLPPTLTLGDDDLVLRDWQERDAPALEPVCGEWDICQFTTVPWTYSVGAARAWIARLGERRANGSGLALAITHRDRPIPMGNVNLVRFSADGREAALGYWLAPAARGHGFAVGAAQLLCAWGFQELRLARIEMAILPENAASHGVAKRLGAQREGVRVASHESGGQRWDMVIYSLREADLS